MANVRLLPFNIDLFYCCISYITFMLIINIKSVTKMLLITCGKPNNRPIVLSKTCILDEEIVDFKDYMLTPLLRDFLN